MRARTGFELNAPSSHAHNIDANMHIFKRFNLTMITIFVQIVSMLTVANSD